MSAPFSFNVQRTNSGHGTSDINSLRKATLMDNPIRWILKRIAERIVPLVGDALAGTLATMLSLGRAEQQNELEEAARRYDAEDKPQIAQALRQQASKLAALRPGRRRPADWRQPGARRTGRPPRPRRQDRKQADAASRLLRRAEQIPEEEDSQQRRRRQRYRDGRRKLKWSDSDDVDRARQTGAVGLAAQGAADVAQAARRRLVGR
jgi:hypothetical protein